MHNGFDVSRGQDVVAAIVQYKYFFLLQYVNDDGDQALRKISWILKLAKRIAISPDRHKIVLRMAICESADLVSERIVVSLSGSPA